MFQLSKNIQIQDKTLILGVLVVFFLFLTCIFFVVSAILRRQSNKRAAHIASGEWVKVPAKIIRVTQQVEPLGYEINPYHHMKYSVPCYCYYVSGFKRTAFGKNGRLPKDCKPGMQVSIYIDRQTGDFCEEEQDRWLLFSRLFAMIGGGLLLLTVVCVCIGVAL